MSEIDSQLRVREYVLERPSKPMPFRSVQKGDEKSRSCHSPSAVLVGFSST